MAEMNQKLSTFNRIVIYPKYRAICLREKINRVKTHRVLVLNNLMVMNIFQSLIRVCYPRESMQGPDRFGLFALYESQNK